MNIQSISIVVPTKKCVNNCKFCVSKMHGAISTDGTDFDGFDSIMITKRLKYAQINNITSCILTGTGEPLQNRNFLIKLAGLFELLGHPFPNLEIQTTGVFLTRMDAGAFTNINLLKNLGVNTISLSVSDIFDDDNNMDIIGVPKKERFKLAERIFWLKTMGFNIRLSLNMTNSFDDKSPKEIINRCSELGADQITFRELWYNNDKTKETQWVKENSCKPNILKDLKHYIVGYTDTDGYLNEWWVNGNGKSLYRLPFGSMVYSIKNMSVVIDDNCMNDKEESEILKYVILKENGKLYCRWDDKGSLIF
jgi:hypothetical protein